MKIIILILLLNILSFSALSKGTNNVLENNAVENNAVEKEESDLRYGGGVGASHYDTIEGESKPYRGNLIYFSWEENLKKSRLTLRESAHGLQVLTSVNTKQAQKNWDLEYSWDEYLYSNRIIDLYLSPIIGGKVKEELTVKCRRTDRVCFDSFIDDWKITDKKQELRPLVGLQSGIRIKLFHVVINPQLFLKTDFENTYYGIEITLGGEQ